MNDQSQHYRTRPGFSLIEVTVSTLIVGLLMVVAMRALGAALRASRSTAGRGVAALLAEDLMAEILQKSYAEPDDAVVFGKETGEDAGGRAAFDDVDDYHGWNASPPQDERGNVLPDRAGWRRRVTVRHVDPQNLASPLSTADDRGVKQVVVTVEHQNEVTATLIGFHTDAWQDMIPTLGSNTTGAAPPVNGGPTAMAGAAPLSGNDPLTVDFDAAGSTDPDGDPLTYSWDFGDGTAGSGSVTSHTFSGKGVYTVTLTAADGDGAQDTDTLNITVK